MIDEALKATNKEHIPCKFLTSIILMIFCTVKLILKMSKVYYAILIFFLLRFNFVCKRHPNFTHIVGYKKHRTRKWERDKSKSFIRSLIGIELEYQLLDDPSLPLNPLFYNLRLEVWS